MVLDIHDLAQIDDKHMAISCGWAEGSGAEAFAAWLHAHEVDDLPDDVVRAIVAFNTNTAGDDDPLTIIDAAEAEYGGGREANYWYAASDGTTYGRDASGQYAYVVPAADLASVPPIRHYRYIGAGEEAS